jgi:hypothetical protein
MTALTEPTVRQRAPRQTPEQRQAIYEYVDKRDGYCAAYQVMEGWAVLVAAVCAGRHERHHAGVKFGSNRDKLTDPRHVIGLCNLHHRTWAPSHSRDILRYLDDVETARERARHDAEEDQRDR